MSEYLFRRLINGKDDDIKMDLSELGCKLTEVSFGCSSIDCRVSAIRVFIHMYVIINKYVWTNVT